MIIYLLVVTCNNNSDVASAVPLAILRIVAFGGKDAWSVTTKGGSLTESEFFIFTHARDFLNPNIFGLASLRTNTFYFRLLNTVLRESHGKKSNNPVRYSLKELSHHRTLRTGSTTLYLFTL